MNLLRVADMSMADVVTGAWTPHQWLHTEQRLFLPQKLLCEKNLFNI